MATDINTTLPSSRPAQVKVQVQAQVQTQAQPQVQPQISTRVNTQASVAARQSTSQNTQSSSNAAPSPPAANVNTQQVAQAISESADRSAAELQDFQEKLEEAVSNINEYTQNIQRSLQFSISDADGRTIIKVIDSETDQVVRQIPPDEVLSISENLGSAGNGGLFFQTKV